MTALTIRLVECNYADGVESTRHPSWSDIENAIRSLEDRPGRIDVWEDRKDGMLIIISGSPGVYAVDVLKDEENAAMLVNQFKSNDSVVEVFGEEYREDQVVCDLDTVIAVVKNLVDANEFVTPTQMEWEHRSI